MGDADRHKDPYYDVLFHGFEGRLEALENIERYGGMPLMFYRNNLVDHGLMVSWIVAEILPYAKKTFPEDFGHKGQLRALTQALVHDDAEIITGDVTVCDKLKANKRQLELWENQEERALEKLASKFPGTVNGFLYEEMLLSAMNKDSLIGQVVSYCDKLVGMGESHHEIYAGNTAFIKDARGNTPTQGYITLFIDRKNWPQWTDLAPFFRYNHPFLNKPELINVAAIANHPKSKPHTEQSIRQPTGNKFYDKYKEVILERGGQRGLELLVNQREFPEK